MKKFAFKLETLLRYRVSIEEKERNTLTLLSYRLHSELSRLDGLHNKEKGAMSELAQARADAVDDPETQWYYPYLEKLRLEIERSKKQIAQVEKEIDAQKTVVLEAIRKKKVLDTMKSKKLKEFGTSVDKLEQKAVDEIMTNRSGRKET